MLEDLLPQTRTVSASEKFFPWIFITELVNISLSRGILRYAGAPAEDPVTPLNIDIVEPELVEADLRVRNWYKLKTNQLIRVRHL